MEAELLKIDFQEHFDRLVKWFRINMTSEQAGMTYSRIRHLPLEGFKASVDYFIDNSKPTPGNFPTTKEITNKVYGWLETHPEEKFKRAVYDKTEDFSYPLQKLWQGYEIFMKQGEEAFSKFAQQSHMPSNDQDRVRMKAKIVKENREADFKLETNKLLEAAGNKVPF